MAGKYVFKTGLKWSGFTRGTLSSPGKLNIGIAIPPEFKGEEGFWSPEELLIAAVDSCIMTTFLAYAGKKKVSFETYTSRTEGLLEKMDGRFMISSILIKPEILVKNQEQVDEIKKLMDLAEKNCFVSNSVKAEIKVIPEIKTGVSNE